MSRFVKRKGIKKPSWFPNRLSRMGVDTSEPGGSYFYFSYSWLFDISKIQNEINSQESDQHQIPRDVEYELWMP